MKKAFTIIELIISVSVIGIIVATSVVGFNSYRTQQNLNLTTNEAVQELSNALNLSYAVDKAGATGYGVVFFQDAVDGKYKFTLYRNDISDPIETIEARSGIEISPSTSIFFEVPVYSADTPYSKTTNFTAPFDTSDEAEIVFSLGGAFKTVVVNKHSNIIKIK